VFINKCNRKILDFTNSFRLSPRQYSDTGDQGGDGNEDDKGGQGDGSSGSGTGDGSDGKKPDEPAIKDPEKKKLSDEAAKYRTSLRDAEAKLTEAQKKLQEFEDKDRTDLEKAQRDNTKLSDENEKLKALVDSQALKVAWVESGAAALFKNPSAAFKLIEIDQVEVKDGVADAKAIKELADSLAKSGDVVLASSSSGDEDGERNPSGAPTNGKVPNGKPASREALEKKFPALRTRTS